MFYFETANTLHLCKEEWAKMSFTRCTELVEMNTGVKASRNGPLLRISKWFTYAVPKRPAVCYFVPPTSVRRYQSEILVRQMWNLLISHNPFNMCLMPSQLWQTLLCQLCLCKNLSLPMLSSMSVLVLHCKGSISSLLHGCLCPHYVINYVCMCFVYVSFSLQEVRNLPE